MIAPLVEAALPEIRALCERYGVERMSLFGSATTEKFSPETSDVDCLVKFFDSDKRGIVNRYWELTQGLEHTLQHPVDLLTERSVKNPIFRDCLEQSKILIYESSNTKSLC
ncbi:MAG: nucleotidyltransferase family protein [Chthoniobacterales bacterium]